MIQMLRIVKNIFSKGIFWSNELLLLFINPSKIGEFLKSQTRNRRLISITAMYFCLMFIVILATLFIRLVVIYSANDEVLKQFKYFLKMPEFLINYRIEIITILTIGIISLILLEIIIGMIFGIMYGFVLKKDCGYSLGFWIGVIFLIPTGMNFFNLSFVSMGIIVGIFGGINEWISLAIFSGITLISSIVSAIIISDLRIYYLHSSNLIIWPFFLGQKHLSHSIYFEDIISLRCSSVNYILLNYAGSDYKSKTKIIEKLIDNYPSFRNEALKAKIVLLSQQAANLKTIYDLDSIISQLPEECRGQPQFPS